MILIQDFILCGVGKHWDRFFTCEVAVAFVVAGFTDVEMVFNGIITLILVVPEADAESVVTLFCEKVGKAPAGDKRGVSRLRM